MRPQDNGSLLASEINVKETQAEESVTSGVGDFLPLFPLSHCKA